jgi:hypothetical protein
MAGIVAASVIGGAAVLSGVGSYLGGKAAARGAENAANVSAAAQREQLEYLKEINALPQELKEQALKKYGSLFGIGGDPSAQGEMIDRAKSSPMYSEIMGGLQAGEESIMRNAAMTGGLRSGNVQGALADYATQLKNKALTDAYNQQLSGLTGIANLPTNEASIGQTMANIGNTRAQGILGAGQAKQAMYQNLGNTLMQGVGMGLEAGII